MENPNTNQLFKEDEIAYICRWDKERNDYVSIPFPKIGGIRPDVTKQYVPNLAGLWSVDYSTHPAVPWLW